MTPLKTNGGICLVRRAEIAQVLGCGGIVGSGGGLMILSRTEAGLIGPLGIYLVDYIKSDNGGDDKMSSDHTCQTKNDWCFREGRERCYI